MITKVLNNISIKVSDSEEELAEMAAEHFNGIHLKSNRRLYVLPGGKTPNHFFNKLSQLIEEWNNTTILLSDEKIVPIDDAISNQGNIIVNLINKIKATQKPDLINFFRFMKEDIDHNEKFIQEIGKPNLAVLGIGLDGHTAAIFPGSYYLNNDSKLVVHIKNENELFGRISLSFGYIMSSSQIAFIVTGKKKAEILKKCLSDQYEPKKYPVQYIFKHFKNPITIFCDKEAAQKL